MSKLNIKMEKIPCEEAGGISVKVISSLEKIFPYKKPSFEIQTASILKNERLNFQLVVFSDKHVMDGRIDVEGELAKYVTVFSEDYVAVTNETSRWPAHDDYRINNEREMGIYPDVLRPIDAYKRIFKKNVYTPFWVSVDTKGEVPNGKYFVGFKFFDENDALLSEVQFEIEILEESLAEEAPYIMNWLHFDSICNTHRVKYLSNQFYKIFNEYLKNAVAHGMNVLFTPALSVAVDSDIGVYRKDVQLLDITETEREYEFDFTKLERFIDNARALGIEKFCFSHIASQWGAKCAIRVRVNKNGKNIYKFGWNVPSDDEEYTKFLSQYLQSLDKYLDEKGLKEQVYLNISDETSMENSSNYERLSKLIRENSKGIKILDTTGESYYIDNELMDVPVISSNKYSEISPKKDCWVYYCCAQRSDYLSNRFINMPSQRNRVLGFQLYLNNVKGFLHWGYNFYAGYLSRQSLNPYFVNDGMGLFEAGDCFMVYPTEKGCVDSLRNAVFYDAIQDYRALKTLEKYIGRSKVIELLASEGLKGFTEYPRDMYWHIKFREKINRMIIDSIQVNSSKAKEVISGEK